MKFYEQQKIVWSITN